MTDPQQDSAPRKYLRAIMTLRRREAQGEDILVESDGEEPDDTYDYEDFYKEGQEEELKSPRRRRYAWVVAEFENRRQLLILTIVLFLLLPTLLLFLPQSIWGFWPFAVIAGIVLRFGPLWLFSVWRCPKCNARLPLNTRFGPFVRNRNKCPNCGVRFR